MPLTALLETVTSALIDHPLRVLIEALFAVAFIFVLMRRGRSAASASAAAAAKGRGPPLPPLDEQERRIAQFRSRLFREDNRPSANTVRVGRNEEAAGAMPQVEARAGCRLTLRGDGECLDLATDDFHSFATHTDVVAAARGAVVAYGVGSCGPRGFYGTIKPHMVMEEALAKFLRVEDAIVYSFSFATVSTLISCYAGRGEYLVVDEDVSLAVADGCELSRANVRRFRHNDMAHLERILSEIAEEERQGKKLSRRFVVTEGVFRNGGDLCPLPRVLELCEAHKFRLILEDSYGFGALGATARGTPEHFGIPAERIDVYVGSLSTALGAVGGFCAGRHEMVDYQRLAATAYVFSASLPPYLTTAAAASLKLLDTDATFAARLQENAKFFREALRSAQLNKEKIVMIECEADVSPIVVLRPTEAYAAAHAETIEDELECVVQSARKRQVLLLRHLFDRNEKCANRPSLRIMLKGSATKDELRTAAEVIIQSVKEVFA